LVLPWRRNSPTQIDHQYRFCCNWMHAIQYS
jgi:hypothetical protein